MLDSLRDALRRYRRHWDIRFAAGGEEAPRRARKRARGHALAHELRPDLGDGTPAPSLDLAYLERLGVAGELGRWRELAA